MLQVVPFILFAELARKFPAGTDYDHVRRTAVTLLIVMRISALWTSLLVFGTRLYDGSSALDTTSERAVVEALGQVRDNYTTVIVTHRPAMPDIADRVVVMADGRIVESGTPAEPETAGGEYARLPAGWGAAADWQLR